MICDNFFRRSMAYYLSDNPAYNSYRDLLQVVFNSYQPSV